MNRQFRRRMDGVHQAIASRPLIEADVTRAFERFCEHGELPEHPRLAKAVVDRALHDPQAEPVFFDVALRNLMDIHEAIEAGTFEPEPMPLREALFREALDARPIVRVAARGAITVLVAAGFDVTDADFVPPEAGVPEVGTIGLHILGFPHCVATAPFEEQGARVLQQLSELRTRLPRCPQEKGELFAAVARAIVVFRSCGTLPDDDLVRDVVLTEVEFLELARNYRGRADHELLGAFNRLACSTTSSDRREATAALCQLVAQRGHEQDLD